MTQLLQTKRLSLRELNLNDTDFIVHLLNTPGWLRFIGDRKVRTEEEAISYLKNGPIKSYLENGFGLYLVETIEDGNPIGMCGLLKRDVFDHPDLGFAFLPEYHGNGYAFECARAAVDYAFRTLKIPALYAITVPYNERSIRLLGKLGFSFSKIVTLTDEELQLHVLQAPQND